ncbi:MAG: head decoration protein, partial [Pseudomonadota bacterium]
AAVFPATGTAGANTGDGTMTGVADGGAAQIGTYTLTCIEVPEGAAVVPATGTAGANTGDGTMTGVADGGAAQIGTYTLTCIEVPEGAAVVPATGTAGGGNTGAGTMTGVADGGVAKIGTYNMICTDATVSGSEIFQVTDPDGLLLAPATVGVAYVNAQINLTINDGGADFIVGDTFTVVVTEADHNAGTFSVVDPDGNELPNATVAVAYTNAQLNFTINDGAADFIAGDTFTLAVTEADHDAGTFSVLAPNGEALPNATVGVAYVNDQINLTLTDGAADFIAGDTFTIPVTAGTGYVVELAPSAVDGTQVPYGFLIAAVDASLAAVEAVAIVRGAQVITENLAWPAGITVDQKAAAIAELKLLGIVARTKA